MKFGVVLPNIHPSLADADLLLRAARAADEIGWDSIWLNDHVVMPSEAISDDPVRARYGQSKVFDPCVMLGVLAGITDRIQIGISVLVLPYRHPVLTAKMVTTADQMSGGRVILGIGTGWMKKQFEALSVDYERRGPMTDEYLKVMRLIWSNEEPSFSGNFVTLDGIRVVPRPTNIGGPEIWVGGRTKRSARRSVEHEAAWHPSHWTLGEIRERRSWLVNAAGELGKTVPPMNMRLNWLEDGQNEDDPGLPAHGAAAVEYAQQLTTFGVEHLVVEVGGASEAEFMSRLNDFAEDVVEPFRTSHKV